LHAGRVRAEPTGEQGETTLQMILLTYVQLIRIVAVFGGFTGENQGTTTPKWYFSVMRQNVRQLSFA
jgi:hypothetical protein